MNQTEKSEEGRPAGPKPQLPALLRNAAWMAWSGAVNIASGILIWVMMARWWDAAELGRFAVVMSTYTIFYTLCALGLVPYLTSEIARREDARPFVASAAAFLFAWSVVCAAAMSVTGYVMSDSSEVWRATVLLSLAIIPTGLTSVAEAAFTACGKTRVIAIASTGEQLLRTLLPFILLYRGHGLVLVCLPFVGVRLVACAIYALAARGHLAALFSAKWSLVREIAASSPTFAGVTTLAALHWQATPLLLGKLGAESAAAEFGVASRFLLPLVVLLPSYACVVQPMASKLAAVSRARLGEFLSESLKVVCALTLPFAVGATLLSRELLTIIFGEKYAGAAGPLSLLALSVIPFGVVLVTARGLIATGHQRVDLMGNAVAAASNLLFNLVLIPRYGALGAAAAQLLSMVMLAAVEVGYATYRLFRLAVWRAVAACVWPLAVMVLAVCGARGWGLWGAVAAGGAAYLALLWVTEVRNWGLVRG